MDGNLRLTPVEPCPDKLGKLKGGNLPLPPVAGVMPHGGMRELWPTLFAHGGKHELQPTLKGGKLPLPPVAGKVDCLDPGASGGDVRGARTGNHCMSREGSRVLMSLA